MFLRLHGVGGEAQGRGGSRAPSKARGLAPHVALAPAARELRGESGDHEAATRATPAAPEGAGPAALRFPGYLSLGGARGVGRWEGGPGQTGETSRQNPELTRCSRIAIWSKTSANAEVGARPGPHCPVSSFVSCRLQMTGTRCPAPHLHPALTFPHPEPGLDSGSLGSWGWNCHIWAFKLVCIGVLLWHSGLRIWCHHCSGLVCCCDAGSFPGPRISTWLQE